MQSCGVITNDIKHFSNKVNKSCNSATGQITIEWHNGSVDVSATWVLVEEIIYCGDGHQEGTYYMVDSLITALKLLYK